MPHLISLNQRRRAPRRASQRRRARHHAAACRQQGALAGRFANPQAVVLANGEGPQRASDWRRRGEDGHSVTLPKKFYRLSHLLAGSQACYAGWAKLLFEAIDR